MYIPFTVAQVEQLAGKSIKELKGTTCIANHDWWKRMCEALGAWKKVEGDWNEMYSQTFDITVKLKKSTMEDVDRGEKVLPVFV